MDSSSEVLEISDASFLKDLEVISLEGQFFHMIGLKTPDQIVFLARRLSTSTILRLFMTSGSI